MENLIIEKAYVLFTQVIALFTIMNSVSAGAIMLGLVPENVSKKELTQIAAKNTKAVFISMIILYILGVYIFKFFGISPMALRVFGGLILLLMGISMVQGHDKKVNTSQKEKDAAMDKSDISIVPLAIPIIIGPGLATALITLNIEASDWTDYVVTFMAIVIVAIANYLLLSNMNFIKVRLGLNGIKVLNRVMGLVVGSLAIQMIVQGVEELWKHFA